MIAIDVMVAGIEVPGMFKHGQLAAGFSESTKRMFRSLILPGRLFEQLNIDPADILPDPPVENRAHECAKGFRRNRLRAHPAATGPHDQRQEHQVPYAHVLAEAI